MAASGFNPAWIIAVGSLSSAVIGAISIRLAWRAHKEVQARKRPRVRLLVVSDPVRRGSLQIVIENVGEETAYDILFSTPFPIPLDNSKPPSEGENPSSFKHGPFANGIPALARGDRRVVNWGEYQGLSAEFKRLEKRFVPVTSKFVDARKKSLSDLGILEVESFSCSRPDDNPLRDISRDISVIQSTLRNHLNPMYKSKPN